MYLYLLNRMLWLGTISTFFIEVTLSSLPLDVKKTRSTSYSTVGWACPKSYLLMYEICLLSLFDNKLCKSVFPFSVSVLNLHFNVVKKCVFFLIALVTCFRK